MGQAAEWFAASGRRIPPQYVEKDFWVTEALRSLSQQIDLEIDSNPQGTLHGRVIFKGGTSLSKAHGLIDRFSEDIDLYVVTRFQPSGEETPVLPDFPDGEGVSDKRADKLLAALALRVQTDVGREVIKDDQKDPRTGTRRAYKLTYSTEGVPETLRPHVLIELTRMGNPEPNGPHQMRSLVNEFVIASGLQGADFAEFEPVTMDVLMPHRTLVEKLCALESAANGLTDRPDALAYMARHFYDVYQLLGSESVVESLASDIEWYGRHCAGSVERSHAVRRQTGPRPDGGFGYSVWVVDSSRYERSRDLPTRSRFPTWPSAISPSFDAVCERGWLPAQTCTLMPTACARRRAG